MFSSVTFKYIQSPPLLQTQDWTTFESIQIHESLMQTTHSLRLVLGYFCCVSTESSLFRLSSHFAKFSFHNQATRLYYTWMLQLQKKNNSLVCLHTLILFVVVIPIDGKPPHDSDITVVIFDLQATPRPTLMVMSVLAVLGTVLAVLFLGFNIWKRQHKLASLVCLFCNYIFY